VEKEGLIMKLTLAEPKYLKDTISIISELVSEATFKIDKEGIELVAMDPANVSMILFKLFSSAFVEYKVDEPVELGVNLSNLKQILRRANPSDMVSLSLVGKGKLKVLFSGNSKRKFFLPIIDVDQEEQKIPDLKFQAKLKLDSKMLANAIEDADIVSDSLSFEVEKDKLTVKAEGDLSQSETEIPAGEDVSIVLNGDVEKLKSKYSIEYLKKMMSASKIAGKCELRLGDDYPLRLEFNEVDKVSLSFILAPRVEYE
jgi:proliferating cell nuclear antigen